MTAVQNQVRVKGFCSLHCLQTFVASLEASATCAWCDRPIKGTTRLLGGNRERYCSPDHNSKLEARERSG